MKGKIYSHCPICHRQMKRGMNDWRVKKHLREVHNTTLEHEENSWKRLMRELGELNGKTGKDKSKSG